MQCQIATRIPPPGHTETSQAVYRPRSRRLAVHRDRHAALLIAVLAVLILTACQSTRKRLDTSETLQLPSTTSMPSTPAAGVPAPHHDAAQVLQHTLRLIGEASSVHDLSPQRLGDTYGVTFASRESGRHAFAAQIDRDWWYSLQIANDIGGAPRFDLSFDQAVPSARDVTMTDICQVDFDQFGRQLQALGFLRTPRHAEHGRHVSDVFERGTLRVEVFARGESESTSETAAHACVKMISVR